MKDAFCVLSDSGTAAEEGLFYKVPNVSLRMATERPETIESGGTIVSGMDVESRRVRRHGGQPALGCPL